MPDDGVVSAQAVGLGLTALPNRQAIEKELVPDEQRCTEVAAAIEDLPRRWFLDDAERQEQVDAIQAALDSGVSVGKLDAARVARYMTALRDVHVRDAVAVASRRRRPRDQRAVALRAAQRFWLALTRSAPRGWVAPPATLLAMTTYRLGDGARANAALDRAFADDPDYSLRAPHRPGRDPGRSPVAARDHLAARLASARQCAVRWPRARRVRVRLPAVTGLLRTGRAWGSAPRPRPVAG